MKILCSDFDGTLSHGGLDSKKCEAIHAWRVKGNKFGIISGRGATFSPYLKETYPQLELDFLAMCNGAIILDGDGKLIFRAVCRELPFRILANELFEAECPYFNVCGANDDWRGVLSVSQKAENLPTYATPENSILIDDMFEIEQFTQICAVQPNLEKAALLAKSLRERYGEWLNPMQNGECIDIPPRGIGKAGAVRYLMEHFGAAYDDMITVGDNMNDADMLREFRSYAMASGMDAVKPLANGIVSDVVEIFQIEENAASENSRG